MFARASSSGAPRAAAFRRWWRPAGLVLATFACYANSLDGPFLYDDLGMANPLVFRTRPIVGLSFAANRALGNGTQIYHLFNVLVHAVAGLFLFGVVRRALALVRGETRAVANAWVAWTVALVWLLHPLQTESVAYISQRAESLAGLFTLGLLYGFVRFATGARALPWALFALASFALGMATKETVAVAPLFVLLCERQFLAGGWRPRARFHAALVLLWLLLFALFPGRQILDAFAPVEANALVGVGATFTPLEYARTQPAVILHYLRLALWPAPLCLDYGWPAARTPAEYVPQLVVILALGIGTLVALVRSSWLGFVGAWFFVNLAPTSSFVPLEDAAVEHRTYLPLAALVLLWVLLLERLWRALAPGRVLLASAGVALLAGAAAAGTVRRNHDYRSALAMWATVVARAPHNPRGHSGLGLALVDAGRTAEAADTFARVIELGPTPTDHLNLGLAYLHSNQFEKALEAFEPIQGSFPPGSKPGQSLGRACRELEAHYRRALELEPAAAEQQRRLGDVLRLEGKTKDALQAYEEAVRLAPDLAGAHTDLGLALFALGRRAEAFEHFSRAVALAPGGAQEHFHLGRWYLSSGQLDDAAAQFRAAARLDAGSAQPRQALARILIAKAGASEAERREALRFAEEAAALEPRDAETLEALGLSHAALGDGARAAEAFERALAALPRWHAGPLRERLRAQVGALRSGTARARDE